MATPKPTPKKSNRKTAKTVRPQMVPRSKKTSNGNPRPKKRA